jgi:hypothetical protein
MDDDVNRAVHRSLPLAQALTSLAQYSSPFTAPHHAPDLGLIIDSWALSIVDRFTPLPLEERAAKVPGRIDADLSRQGLRIGRAERTQGPLLLNHDA